MLAEVDLRDRGPSGFYRDITGRRIETFESADDFLVAFPD
jgi:hypothetical protein